MKNHTERIMDIINKNTYRGDDGCLHNMLCDIRVDVLAYLEENFEEVLAQNENKGTK